MTVLTRSSGIFLDGYCGINISLVIAEKYPKNTDFGDFRFLNNPMFVSSQLGIPPQKWHFLCLESTGNVQMIDRDMGLSVSKTSRCCVHRRPIQFPGRFKYYQWFKNEYTFCEYAINEVRVT